MGEKGIANTDRNGVFRGAIYNAGVAVRVGVGDRRCANCFVGHLRGVDGFADRALADGCGRGAG